MTLDELFAAQKPLYMTGRELRRVFHGKTEVLEKAMRHEKLGQFVDNDVIEVTEAPASPMGKGIKLARVI